MKTLAQLDHDVRTPMSTVAGLAFLLSKSPLNPDQRALLERMDAATKSLLHLISDVLARAREGLDDVACASSLESVDSSSPLVASRGTKEHGGDAGGAPIGSDPASAGAARLTGVHVLVADDSPINLAVTKRILERDGAQVTIALDGEQAVALLRATPHQFHAVLMDMQMPRLGGVEATRQIRSELGLKRLPLIALTGELRAAERERALEAGMDSIISKPLDPDSIVDLLLSHLQQAPVAPLGTPGSPVPESSAPWPAIDGIDGAEVRSRLQGDLSLFTRMLASLCQDFADMSSPVPFPDSAAARSAMAARLHKLGGIAGLLAARSLRDAAALGEAAMHGLAGEEDARGLLTAVAASLGQLVGASGPWLTQSKLPHDRDVSAEPKALEAETLSQWKAQLRSHDFEALARFQQLAPSLRAAWGHEQFGRVEAAIDKLDFPRAFKLVSACC